MSCQQEDNILNRTSNSALFNRFFMHKQLKFRVSFMYTVITKTNKPMFHLWARRQSILIEKTAKTDICSEGEDWLHGRRWDMSEKTNCFSEFLSPSAYFNHFNNNNKVSNVFIILISIISEVFFLLARFNPTFIFPLKTPILYYTS